MILSQTLLRRSKNIYMSIKSTQGLYWRLYPRYEVTFFFPCNSINKSWDKTAYLKHLTGDFYSAQSALGTQTITFPLHNGLIFMAQVALGLSWMCTLPSPGFVPALEPLCIPLCFLTNELKRISTGEYLSWKKKLPPLLRDKQIRLNKLERVPQTHTVITKSCLR